MLKKCKVLLNNDAVTVIQYDDVKVQIPAIGRKTDVVMVKTDGSYTVVPDDYKESEDSEAVREKKAQKKKPVITENTSEINED